MPGTVDVLDFSPGGVFVGRAEKGSVHLLAFEDMIAEKKKEDKKEPDKKEPDKKEPDKKEPDKKQADNKDEAAAENSIKALDGVILRDDTQAGKPVIEVSLANSGVKDTDLKVLAALKQLRKLKLSSTNVRS